MNSKKKKHKKSFLGRLLPEYKIVNGTNALQYEFPYIVSNL